MLSYGTQFYASVLIVLELCQVSTSNRSIIIPNGEIIVNEGETLMISCMGYAKIVFSFPSYNDTSPYQVHENITNGIYTITFQRRRTVFSDTGWYSCTYRKLETVNYVNNFYDPEMNWLYVYVQSERSAFVEANTNAHLNATVGDSVVIPCRTVSPVIKPVLISSKEFAKEPSYDPKIGFTVRNLSLDDSGSYKCLTEMNKKEYTVNYTLSVHRIRQILTELKISNSYFINDNLYISCVAEMDHTMQFVPEWNTPRQNSNKRTQEFRKHLDDVTILVTSQLTIFNVTEEDSGDYECVIRTIYGKKKTTKKITITPHLMKSIDFISSSNYYRKESGTDVEWEIQVKDKFNNSYLQWFNPNGEKIMQSPKYYISFKYSLGNRMAHLKILLLNILDSGSYTLQAENQYIVKRVNITLDVINKPFPVLIPLASHYAHNKSAEFRCEVTSNPLPIITWHFLKCPNYLPVENSTINATQSANNNSSYKFESIAKILIDVSGKITCEACNEIGCNSVTEDIVVSNQQQYAFDIIGPKESVVKGDNIELICATSNYNYTYEFKWTKLVNQTVQPLEETGRLKIVNDNISFTRRSTLKLYNVQESDATNYVCTGEIVNTSNNETLCSRFDRVNYELVIHEPVTPYFIKTNINETKTRIIDMITEGRNIMILQCYAGGMPKPKVTWYKNNQLLKKNDQYFFKHNHQELHIKYFMQHDSGMYLCQAVSRVGSNVTYQQITVKTKWHTFDVGQMVLVLIISISILGFILIISTTYFTIKLRRNKRMKNKSIDARLNFEKGALKSLNPKLTVHEQLFLTELLPYYDKTWEFPRERLILQGPLSSGNFGVIMKAEAIGICKGKNITVAVKMVRRTTEPIYIHMLANELKILMHLGKHLNIITLIGACTKNIFKSELLIIFEYCRFGNLHNYLLRHRNDFISQIDNETRKLDFTIGMNTLKNVSVNDLSDDNEDNPVFTKDLLSWAFQLARGMEYLSQRKIVHCDLAARNILLAEDNVVKISDFGLAKDIYKYDNYEKKDEVPMPIKWMAVESIRNGIFSIQSDVWSFGVMLWEFFTLAETPYPNIDVIDTKIFHQKLIEGYRMEKPDYATDEVYDIMLQCWMAKPTLRPSFTDLVRSIENVLEKGLKMHYITLNNSCTDINDIIMNL